MLNMDFKRYLPYAKRTKEIIINIVVLGICFLLLLGFFKVVGIAKKPVMEEEYKANIDKIIELSDKFKNYTIYVERANKNKEINQLKTQIDANTKEIANLKTDIETIKSKLK